jgi:L-threonylcarbamoyladenylate synthase
VQTDIIPVDPATPDPAALARAAQYLNAGAVVAFPTETVYGLGCLPEHEESVARIYAIKNRPRDWPLAVYLADAGELVRRAGSVSAEARRLIAHYLPGPLTIVLEEASGSKTGFRVSPDPVLTGLLRAVGRPLVGTSANPSGAPSPTKPDEVLEAFDGRIELILDAGTTRLGTDSTVIDCTVSPPSLIREGAIPATEIASVLGVTLGMGREPPPHRGQIG